MSPEPLHAGVAAALDVIHASIIIVVVDANSCGVCNFGNVPTSGHGSALRLNLGHKPATSVITLVEEKATECALAWMISLA